MSETNHPGWKPEGFMRKQLSLDDVAKILAEMQEFVPEHFVKYGAGIFTHPHEIVGCMFGQLTKLSQAADESIYSGDIAAFRLRCWKTLMAILMGIMSADKLNELRKNNTDIVEPAPENNTVVVHLDEPDKICGRSKAVAAIKVEVPTTPGLIRDSEGCVLRVSTQKGDAGYDPEVHLNQNLRITCNGQNYPTAHTADTRLGTVWYYEKTTKGRITTKTAEGKVEIHGL